MLDPKRVVLVQTRTQSHRHMVKLHDYRLPFIRHFVRLTFASSHGYLLWQHGEPEHDDNIISHVILFLRQPTHACDKISYSNISRRIFMALPNHVRLKVSHPRIYFPPAPSDDSVVENVIIVGTEQSAAASPAREAPPLDNTIIIFKVKCSAPKRFHVAPCVGIVQPYLGANNGVPIRISLKQQDREGESPTNPRPRSLADTTCSNLAASSSNLIQQQERFAVEGILVRGDAAVREKLIDIEHQTGALLKCFERLSKPEHGSEVVVLKPVALKAHLDNVVWEKRAAGPTNDSLIIVPAEAQVTVVKRKSNSESISPSTRVGRRQSVSSPVPKRPPASSALTPAAVAEADALRKELQELEDAIAETDRDRLLLSQTVDQTNAILDRATVANHKRREAEAAAAKQEMKPRKRGIPFLLVVFLMLLTFSAAIWIRMRRGDVIRNPFSTHSNHGNGNHPSAPSSSFPSQEL